MLQLGPTPVEVKEPGLEVGGAVVVLEEGLLQVLPPLLDVGRQVLQTQLHVVPAVEEDYPPDQGYNLVISCLQSRMWKRSGSSQPRTVR